MKIEALQIDGVMYAVSEDDTEFGTPCDKCVFHRAPCPRMLCGEVSYNNHGIAGNVYLTKKTEGVK